jgi:hypothetical protein
MGRADDLPNRIHGHDGTVFRQGVAFRCGRMVERMVEPCTAADKPMPAIDPCRANQATYSLVSGLSRFSNSVARLCSAISMAIAPASWAVVPALLTA